MDKKDKKSGMKNKKKIFIIIGIIVLSLSVLLSTLLIVINYVKTDDTYRVAKKVAKIMKSDYKYLKVVDEGRDYDFKYSYIQSAYIFTKKNYDENDIAVSIEKYNSNYEAKRKVEFYNDHYDYVYELFENSFLETNEEEYKGVLEKNTMIVVGNYVINIYPKTKNKEIIEKEGTQILKKYNTQDIKKSKEESVNTYWDNQLTKDKERLDGVYSDVLAKVKGVFMESVNALDNCTGNNCKEILDYILEFEKYGEFSEEINAVQNKYNEVMARKQETVNSINNQINEVKRTLSQEQYDSIKVRIGELSDSYYDTYKEEWNNQLSSVVDEIFKHSCGKYGYKDILRNPTDYKGKQAYFFGKIIQKVDSTQYRVGIDCQKYYTMDDYYCDNTIYVTYSGDTRLIEDDMVEMWGTLDGTYTYTTVLGSSLTIPKFDAKYILLK